MKSIIIATTLLLSTLSLAAPGKEGYKDDKYDDKKDKHDDKCQDPKSPFHFTSVYLVTATPDQVVNNVSVPTPGQPGAKGYFYYGINSHLDTICYNITLIGVTGAYSSPAKTATHLHEAPKGKSGPPRLAFPNPVGDDYIRRSVGCLTGPFTTGIIANGKDTGQGFMVKQIEANPSGFFTDTHTTKYLPGAVRGQLY